MVGIKRQTGERLGSGVQHRLHHACQWLPAAGIRLSESPAASHEKHAAEVRSLARNWSVEAGQVCTAAVTDTNRLVERYAHDVSTGTAHALGLTESESASVQAPESHMEKLAEIGTARRPRPRPR